MSTLHLLAAELWHRKMNVTLSLTALVAAATLFVASPTLMDGYQTASNRHLAAMQNETEVALQEMHAETEAELTRMEEKAQEDLATLEKRTRRIMRDLGFNLRIVHANTDLTKLYADFVAFEMPEAYVQKLADSPQITKIVHLVATLRQKIRVNDQDRLLVGVAPEATQSHIGQKAPMGYQLETGTVYLGHVAGEGKTIGDTIEIGEKTFTIEKILPVHGNEEDIAIFMDLADAQAVLGKEGRITEILALGCKCETVERIEEVTAQLETVLPDTKVTEMRLQAIAREDQRALVENHYAQTMEDYRSNRSAIVEAERERRMELVRRERGHRAELAGLLATASNVLVPLIVLICGIWVGLLTWSNVHERRFEIGLMRALGKGSSAIVSLFLGKAMLLGLVAGALGAVLGFLLGQWLGRAAMALPPDSFQLSALAVAGAVLGTPIVAAAASYLPTLTAVRQDPATVLMDS